MPLQPVCERLRLNGSYERNNCKTLTMTNLNESSRFNRLKNIENISNLRNLVMMTVIISSKITRNAIPAPT